MASNKLNIRSKTNWFFSLGKNEWKDITTPDVWAGRLWGRSQCTEDSTGGFSCITGDCGSGQLECSTAPNGSIPVTMAEAAKSAGCVVDLNGVCPPDLEVISSDGKIAGCRKRVCHLCVHSHIVVMVQMKHLRLARLLIYSQNFKKKCPSTYTHPFDDETGTFSCESPEYQIVFCAGNTTVYKSMTTNMTVVSSGPTESPPPQEPSPSPPPQVKKPPSPSPPEITPPSPSPPGIPEPGPSPKIRSKAPIIAGVIGGVLLIISLVAILILRAKRRGQSGQAEQDVEGDHIKQVPGMPVSFFIPRAIRCN
ncbi:hypothetical protein OIU74_002964 [Salix koriyanagi]|uniref:Uncharacterized protein n=1 Tax=Salix koriyanagi TaxID=2511006 RepID=A0A9Q0ZKM3_9ROSI|nr:hypothetical protein OIU74_002964 [Salix koriyanagi]